MSTSLCMLKMAPGLIPTEFFRNSLTNAYRVPSGSSEYAKVHIELSLMHYLDIFVDSSAEDERNWEHLARYYRLLVSQHHGTTTNTEAISLISDNDTSVMLCGVAWTAERAIRENILKEDVLLSAGSSHEEAKNELLSKKNSHIDEMCFAYIQRSTDLRDTFLRLQNPVKLAEAEILEQYCTGE